MLPKSLQARIEILLEEIPSRALIRAQEDLSHRYRDPLTRAQGFASSHEALAYIAARMPATFAAVDKVLSQAPPDIDIQSILDLGAGPGTAALAAALHWPKALQAHLVEGNPFMKGLSHKLMGDLPELNHQAVSFEGANLERFHPKQKYDLVILSYVLNEISLNSQEIILKKAWEATAKSLIIVMPGTPAAYRQLMTLRALLIDLGAYVAAPCPHQKPCPLLSGDWCHFSTRLPRPSYHRQVKNVSLPYEDEKYSYLIVLKDKALLRENMPPKSRIIRNPIHRSGHVTLDLCTENKGIVRETISKKQGDIYRLAKGKDWGDTLL